MSMSLQRDVLRREWQRGNYARYDPQSVQLFNAVFHIQFPAVGTAGLPSKPRQTFPVFIWPHPLLLHPLISLLHTMSLSLLGFYLHFTVSVCLALFLSLFFTGSSDLLPCQQRDKFSGLVSGATK